MTPSPRAGRPRGLALLVAGLLCTLPLAAQPGLRWVTPAVPSPLVQRVLMPSAAAGTTVSAHVYLPPSYARDTLRRFPVLYWLHGSGGGLAGIAPLAQHFDAAMRDGRMPEALIVFPNGHALSMWVDAADARAPVEQVVIRELLPFVDGRYRTIATREGRIVEGFSMGGYGAARYAFAYPELFIGASLLGAGPLDLDLRGPRTQANPAERDALLQRVFGDVTRYAALSPLTLVDGYAQRTGPRVALRLAIGARDFTLPANAAFHARLDALGLAHDYRVVPSVGHEALPLLRGLGDAQWAFYRTLWP
jgi:enterochelin esterase-like enzyme